MIDAVDRDLFARAHPQAVADGDIGQATLRLAAVVGDPPRGLRREVEQCADRARRRRARAQFQHLAEQHQHGDDGGGFEIERDAAVRVAERRREKAAAQSAATTL